MAGAPIPDGDCGCDEPGDSIASVGLCLADGTPIAVIIHHDCDGVTVEDGWMDLTTGIFTPGPPPPGTNICSPDAFSFELGGFLCDILPDGSVAGIALVQIERAPDGSIIGITLVGIDGLPYVPVGVMERCPNDAVTAEILCDGGAGNIPFVRFYAYRASGNIPVRDTDLDGIPYIVIGPIVECAESVSITNWRDDAEYVTLCDTGAALTPFLRRFDVSDTGVVTVTDTTLDGTTPYVVVGTAVVCECRQKILVIPLCDQHPPPDAGDGQLVPFLRTLVADCDGAIISTADTTLDGTTPYTVEGTVGLCTSIAGTVQVTVGNWPDDNEFLVLCDFPAGFPATPLVSFLRRFEVDALNVVTVVDTTLDGVTPYVTVGTVTPCELAAIDFNAEVLCDAGAAGTQFLRRYRDTPLGVIATDTLLDGSTPYIGVGPFGACLEVTGPGGGPVVIAGTVDLGNQFDDEWQILCDSDAPPTTFLRRLRTDLAGTVTAANFTLGGAPFAPVGAVGACSVAVTVAGTVTVDGSVEVSNLRDDEYEILCDAGAAGLPFLRRYRTDFAGVVTTVDTTLDGTTAYAPVGVPARCSNVTGTVTIIDGGGSITVDGAVAITNQFDDEYAVLCDSTPTTFIRRYRTDLAGAVTVANFTLAGGAFVPVGAVSSCAQSIAGTVAVIPLGTQNVRAYRNNLVGVGLWSLAANSHGGKVKSVSIRRRAGGAVGSVTITDNFGTITVLQAGESESWSVTALDDEIIAPLIVTTTLVANDVVIDWTEAP